MSRVLVVGAGGVTGVFTHITVTSRDLETCRRFRRRSPAFDIAQLDANHRHPLSRLMAIASPAPRAAFLWLSLTLLPALYAAGPVPLSAGFETDFSSRYTWRGMAYSRGPVTQPYGWVTAGDFTVSLWGNAILGPEPQQGRFNGGDVTAAWTHDLGRWRIEPAFEYWFDRPVNNESDPPTGEASFRLSARLGPIRFFGNQAIDVVHFRGAYYGDAGPNFTTRAHGLEIELNARQAWASARFNQIYAGVRQTAPTFLGADASATRRFRNGLYLRAHAEVSRMLRRSFRESLGKGTLFSAGLAVGYEWRGK